MKFLNDRLHHLLGQDLDHKIKQYFISGAYKSILLQASIAIITFLSSLFIARITGDKGFGVYATIFTWISIISVGATLGIDDLLLKKIPIYNQNKEYGKIKGILNWANIAGLLTGILAALTLLFLAQYTTISGLYQYLDYYRWAVWVIPFFVLMHINQAALRGLKLFWWGQFAEKLVQPLAFFLLLIAYYFYQDNQLSDQEAIIARTLSFLLTAVVALFLLQQFTRFYRQQKTAIYELKQWQSNCKYFALTSLLYIINTRIDIIFLGIYNTPPEQIAYYNAALKLSDMALIPFAVLYTVTAPMFSELYASGNIQKLQTFYTKTTRLSFLFIAAILIVLVLGGQLFLGLFGESFQQGYTVLMILSLVKFAHILVGPASYLMMMIGLEKEALYILLASVLLTVLLHIYCIPLWGINGAALATLGGLLLFEILVTLVTYQKKGIMLTILGSPPKRKEKNLP